MIVFPNAKINIGLNIVADRPDGYHNLETVFYPIPITDALECVPAKDNLEQDIQFSAYGLPVAGNTDSNLVVKAARLLKSEGYNIPPVELILDKHIPMGSGTGGGSADGAFTLRLLNDMFALGLTDQQMIDYSAKLGADCPFFILNRPVYATGIGEIMTPVEVKLAGYYFVLIRPDVFVSTKEAFSGIKSKPTDVNVSELIKRPIEEWKDCIFNDFEDSIFPKFPKIAEVKQQLYDLGAVYACMTGSGSSVFGLFREAVKADLKQIFPDSFVFKTLLKDF